MKNLIGMTLILSTAAAGIGCNSEEDKLKSQLSSKQTALSESRKENASLQARVAEFESRIEEVSFRESAATDKEAQLASLEATLTAREAEAAQLDAELAQRKAEVDARIAEIQISLQEVSTREQNVSDREVKVTHREAQADLAFETLEMELAELDAQREELVDLRARNEVAMNEYRAQTMKAIEEAYQLAIKNHIMTHDFAVMLEQLAGQGQRVAPVYVIVTGETTKLNIMNLRSMVSKIQVRLGEEAAALNEVDGNAMISAPSDFIPAVSNAFGRASMSDKFKVSYRKVLELDLESYKEIRKAIEGMGLRMLAVHVENIVAVPSVSFVYRNDQNGRPFALADKAFEARVDLTGVREFPFSSPEKFIFGVPMTDAEMSLEDWQQLSSARSPQYVSDTAWGAIRAAIDGSLSALNEVQANNARTSSANSRIIKDINVDTQYWIKVAIGIDPATVNAPVTTEATAQLRAAASRGEIYVSIDDARYFRLPEGEARVQFPADVSELKNPVGASNYLFNLNEMLK